MLVFPQLSEYAVKPTAYLNAKPFGDPHEIDRYTAARMLRHWRNEGTGVIRRVYPAAGYVKYKQPGNTPLNIIVRLMP